MIQILLLLSLINGHNISDNLPVVLMHGIISNCNNMNELKLFLEINFNLQVIVPEIGNGIHNSFNLPLNIQGEMLCNDLNSNQLLSNGFNLIKFNLEFKLLGPPLKSTFSPSCC